MALIFDYESCWAWATQPQGENFDYFRLHLEIYKGLRQLGLSVDILSPDMACTRLDDYDLVFAPGLFSCSAELSAALAAANTRVILGPRTASKTADFQIPADMPPDLPEAIRPARITRVESLADGLTVPVGDDAGALVVWREFAEATGGSEMVMQTGDGRPALLRKGQIDYLCGWPDERLLESLIRSACETAGTAIRPLPSGVRLRRAGNKAFVINYSDTPFDITALGPDTSLLHGEAVLAPSGFAIVRFGGAA